MNKNEQKFIKTILAFVDMDVTLLSFFTAYWVRNSGFGNGYEVLLSIDRYIWMLGVIIPVWIILLITLKVYDVKLKKKIWGMVTILFKLIPVVFIGSVVLASMLYFTDRANVSRLFLGTFSIINLIMLWLDKIIIQLIWSLKAEDKLNYNHVIVVGTGDRNNYTDYVNKNPHLMIHIVGYLLAGRIPFGGNKKVLGNIGNMVEVLKNNVVDEVVFNLPAEYMSSMGELIRECESMGIGVRMVMQIGNMAITKAEIDMLGNLPMIALRTVKLSPVQVLLKRMIDICGAIVGLMITGIAFLFIAPAIKLDSEGPILFGHYRIGRNGRKFRFYKFRSMYKDAEERKMALMGNNEMSGYMFKMTDDPRITKVGAFLRKTSLDELPQFWNILMGDMSLVGTRPPTIDEVEKYDTHHWKRLCIKPGLTGMWQVSGRSDITDFDEVVRLDGEYIDNWSMWLDIRIILQTFIIVFKRKGSR